MVVLAVKGVQLLAKRSDGKRGLFSFLFFPFLWWEALNRVDVGLAVPTSSCLASLVGSKREWYFQHSTSVFNGVNRLGKKLKCQES